MCGAGGGAGLPAAVEDVVELVIGDAGAGVGDGDVDLGGQAVGLDGDAAAFRGETDGVADDVGDHLVEAVAVDRGGALLEVLDDGDPLGVGERTGERQGLVDEVAQGARAALELDLARRRSGEALIDARTPMLAR